MLDVSSHGIMCEGEERDFMNNNTDDNNIDKDNVNTDAAEEIVAEETIFGGTETEPETAASDAAIPDGAGIPIFPDNEASDEADEPDDKPAKKTHRALKITAAIFGAVVVCTYIVISIWFMFHYNYKTYINDIDYSFYSLDDVDAYIESYIQDYSLTLKLRGGEEHVIKPEDISLDIKPNITAKKIISEQNGFLWPYYMLKRKDYDLYYSASYDKDALENLLKSYDSLDESKMEKPEDAYVTIRDGESTIIPESEGNYLDFDRLCCIIDEAIVKGESVLDVSESDAYESPELTADSEEIVNEQKELAKILEMTITYEIDQVSWKLTSKEYGDWISNVKGKWKFSEDKVREYVENIASRYDTYGVPRNFRTHNGDVITLANTWYGWMIDVDGETEELMKLLEAGESTTHTPPFDCYAAVYHDGGDDIAQHAAAAQQAEQHPAQTHQRGVNIEIIRDAGANACQHLVFRVAVQLLSVHKGRSFQLATFTMAKRSTLSPKAKPFWNTSTTVFSPTLSSSTCITALCFSGSKGTPCDSISVTPSLVSASVNCRRISSRPCRCTSASSY